MKYNRQSRRMFLQGSGGLLLSIPFLNSIVPREARAAANEASPLRFVMVTNGQSPNEITFFGQPRASQDPFRVLPGNGLVPSVNTRVLTDIAGEISYILGPLSHLKSNLAVIRGLDVYAFDGGAHPSSFPTAATGFNSGSGDYLNSRQATIDTLIAQTIASSTSPKNRRHMLLSPYLNGGAGPDGLLAETSSSYSFQRNASDPVHGTSRLGAIGNNREILARFFGIDVPAAQAVVPRRQLLDQVLGDFKRVRGLASISTDDRSKLDKYVALINDIETSMDQPVGNPLKGPSLETEMSPPILRRGSGESAQSFLDRQKAATSEWVAINRAEASEIRARNHMRAIAAAFAVDSTRVASIVLGNGSHATHHSSNMQQRNETYSAEMLAFCNAHRRNARSVAFLMDCVAGLADSNGANLLNQSVVYWNQQYGCVRTSGGGHSRSNFPVVLGGGAASKLKLNQYIDYSFANKNPSGQTFGLPLNNLLVTLMNCFGIGSSVYESGSPGYGSYDLGSVSLLPSSVTSPTGRRTALPQLYTGTAVG